MADKSSSCVFIVNRGPEGLTRLEIIPPCIVGGSYSAAADTMLFNKSKYGIENILNVECVGTDGTSAMPATQVRYSVSGDYVTITLPDLTSVLTADRTQYYLTVIGTSREVHDSGGERLLGGGQV